MTLQSLGQPLNQTSFAKAVRLGVESALDAVATTGQARHDNVDMALRWFYAAEKCVNERDNSEVAILYGLGDMLRAFDLVV